MSKRVFDCFIFYNELDLLDLRLNELDALVDTFVLVEAPMTFKGVAKPLVFDENKARFSRFLHKIVHIVADDMPDVADPRLREHHQRRAIARGLVGLAPEDVVVISDVDEILRPSTIETLRSKSGYFLIDMPMFQFHLNTRAVASGWNKVFAYSYRLHEQIPDFSRVRVQQTQTFEKFAGDNHRIEDGGWHFTFLGGAEAVRSKLGAYAHHGGYYAQLQQPGAAEEQLCVGYQLGRHDITDFVDVDASFPNYVRAHLDDLVAKGHVKTPIVRIRELEAAFRFSEKHRLALIAEVHKQQMQNQEPEQADTGVLRNSAEPSFAQVGSRSAERKTINDATPETVGAEIDAIFGQIRAKIRQYRGVAGRYYPGVLDGQPAVPRAELLTSCRLLADRHDLIAMLPKGGVFVEVGTLFGDFIVRVIDLNAPSHVHLFDLSFQHVRPDNRAKLESFGNITYHVGDSSSELAKLTDASVDIVYVDGNHSYAGVWKDLVQALRILKPDGYLVCNDYTNWDPIQCIPYGVFAAVSRFANENHLRFEYLALQQNGFHDVCLRRGGSGKIAE